MFLRSVDITDIVDSTDALYELLKEVLEEVGVRNVLQVVTNCEERYVVAGKRLADTFSTVFWTPCAACCIDFMLGDFKKLEWINTILEQAKSISRFIYNHSTVLNMMRRYTLGVDLVEPGVTRSVTDFTTLKRMVNIKHNLQSMVTSEEWMECPYSKKQEGYTMWEQLQRHPLHVAGFYLNPKFFYSTEGDIHLHRSLVYDCVEKLVPDPKIQDKIVKETTSYHNAVGDFGWKMAARARDTLLPGEWWSTYGGGCPNLARLAIRILSQTCSLILPKPRHIQLEQMHERKNCLEHQRSRDLVFVQYNMWLRQLYAKRNEPSFSYWDQKNEEQAAVDPLAYDNINTVEDWVTEKELCSEDIESSYWTTIEPPYGNIMVLLPSMDEFEALGAGFDDFEIFEGVKDSEEETGEENLGSQ
ncbi:hypothetical protein RJ639_005112 [Escallonia herrerae]|uniref:DUF659 domain-containing protein n=1 Tax=Escallonia herrerae TaxID=1293975 RepID=A0AA88W2V6_9ASTE|nr:hypothetical protein RJ639_005112 [Escallonia herrerae]